MEGARGLHRREGLSDMWPSPRGEQLGPLSTNQCVKVIN